MFKTNIKQLTLSLGLCGMICHLPLHAQEIVKNEKAQNEHKAIEKIVVTSQRRSENVQEVPITVSVFTASELENKGISDLAGISAYAPNVHIDNSSPFSGSSSIISAFVRGIGQSDFAFNLEPGVGVYLDGVYYARTVGANLDMLDVDVIEILKGPQGSLFGRNTIGGAINVTTMRPTNTYSGKINVTVGEFNRLDTSGKFNIPLIDDKLLASVAFSKKGRDGYQKRLPWESDTPYVTDDPRNFASADYQTYSTAGGENVSSVRGKLLWLVNDDLEITFAGDYTRENQESTANTLLAIDNVGLTGLYNACISGLADEGMCDDRYGAGTSIYGVNVDNDTNNDRLPIDDRYISDDIDVQYGTGPSFSIMEISGLSATAEWQLEDFAIKSITAFRQLDAKFGLDIDSTPVTIVDISFSMDQKQFSEELQLSGQAFDNKLNYLAGAYYFHEEGDMLDYVTYPAGLLQIDGNAIFDTTSWALFTHLNYSFTDRLSATIGLRYSVEDKEFEGAQRENNGLFIRNGTFESNPEIFPDQDDPNRLYPLGVQTKSINKLSPRLGVEYKVKDDMMVFASYSEGFKSGGWTTRLNIPQTEVPQFDEETTKAYEIGFKSQWLEDQLRVNGAAFFTDYDDLQIPIQQEGGAQFYQNAGTAEIAGLELDMQALITDEFSLSANVGYLDAKYTYIHENVTIIDLDDPLLKTPEWSVSISPEYIFYFSKGDELALRVDYSYTSEMINDTSGDPATMRKATNIWNASATYTPNDEWYIVLGMTNITDERYINNAQVSGGSGLHYGTYSRPREWYLTTRFEF